MDDYEADLKQIDLVTDALYSSICFEVGEKPELDRLRTLFITEGKLINNNENPIVMSVDQFIEVFNEQLSSGAGQIFL